MRKKDKNFKQISDPVHRTISLSKLEVQIIDSLAFQRLHNISQSALIHYVFPEAHFSRFAHSIGVCHLTGRILEHLKCNNPKITDELIQVYRLAGLLHDIGHYPFSHTGQEAAQDFYIGQDIFEDSDASDPPDTADTPSSSASDRRNVFTHEDLGKEVITQDKEILKILKNAKISSEEVYSIFLRYPHATSDHVFQAFNNLISSDLDVDRVDYLLRGAYHTGLPYGTVDFDYLLNQMCEDDSHRICVTEKALHTADHFLLNRFFAYQQIIYHKTVVGFTKVLEHVMYELFKAKIVDCSPSEMKRKISLNEWHTFDEVYTIQKIRELQKSTKDKSVKEKCNSILKRHPPKLVYQSEQIRDRKGTSKGDHARRKKLLSSLIYDLSEKYKIDRNLWFDWDLAGMELTKVGSLIPISTYYKPGQDKKEKDLYDQAIRICNPKTKKSVAIMDEPGSLMNLLSDYGVYSLRTYVLIPSDKQSKGKKIREEIQSSIQSEMGD